MMRGPGCLPAGSGAATPVLATWPVPSIGPAMCVLASMGGSILPITLRGSMCTASGRLTRLNTSTATAPITALPICASVGTASRCGGPHAKRRSKETPILPRLWLNESKGSAGDDSETAYSASFPMARDVAPRGQIAPLDSAGAANGISKKRPPQGGVGLGDLKSRHLLGVGQWGGGLKFILAPHTRRHRHALPLGGRTIDPNQRNRRGSKKRPSQTGGLKCRVDA